MRWIVSVLMLASATPVFAANVELVRVWPQWHNADTFDRIGEYFGEPEHDGRTIVARSHPEQRAGMYFLVRVKSGTPLTNAKFVLEVIRPDAPDAKTFTFPVSLPAKGGLAELGLTDGDWPGGHGAHAVAWKISLLDALGQVVATRESFLWAKPTS